MNTKTFVRLFILVVLFTILLSGNQATLVSAASAGYTISNYVVKINVSLDNSYSVTESLDVVFPSVNSMHGFYRYIPIMNAQTGQRVSITDIKVTGANYFNTYEETPNMIIQVGDKNTYINGKKHFDISYKFSPGKDPYNSYDMLLFNAIPFDFDAPIKYAYIEINMPKEFDSSNITVFSGSYGTKNNDLNVSRTTIGNKIVLRSTEPLGSQQGISIETKLIEGYFSQASFLVGYLFVLFIPLITIPLILLAIFLWRRFGKDDAVIPVIGFSPPKDYSPIEMGYLIDQIVDSEDIGAMTIYWASHGHIRIVEDGNSYTFFLVEPLDGKHKDYEITTFNRMFELGNGTWVTKKQLENRFYTTTNALKIDVPRSFKSENPSMYEKSSLIASYFILGSAFLLLALFILTPILNLPGNKTTLVFAGISTVLFVAITALFTWLSKVHYKLNSLNKTFSGIALVILSLIFIAVNYFYNTFYGMWFWPPLQFFALTISVIALIFISLLAKKKSRFMLEMLQEILGFKNFLETAEKSRIELLVKENPKYFYKILPYTLVLGVTSIWGEKFNGIAMQPPDWYQNQNGNLYMPSLFALSMLNYNRSISTAFISAPRNSGAGGFGSGFGGGFSGGGGFGGGGFGGGGGRGF